MRVSLLGLRAPGAEGGVETAVAALGPRLVARGFDVRVVCRSGWLPPAFDPAGMELVEVPAPRGAGREALVHSLRGLPAALAGADLVHLHAAGPAGLAPLVRLAGRASVVTLHGADWERDRWGRLARGALRLAWSAAQVADAVVVVSPGLLARTAAVGATWIPNGVDPPGPRAPIAGLEPGFWLVLGRIVPEKNIGTLVAAHARIPDAPPLVVAGSDAHDPREYARLRALAGPRVRFVGARFGPEKAGLLADAALLLCPSRVEGLPLVVLEGLAAGTPILASDIPPHRELLGADPGPSPDDLDGWTRRLAAFDVQSARAAAQARAPAERARWSWDAVADRTAALYRAILARRRRGGPAIGNLAPRACPGPRGV